MNRVNRFQSNLNYGHKMEQKVLEYLPDFVKSEFAPRNRSFKDWDIRLTMADGRTETYEVKCDRCCYRTGNFFVKTGDAKNNPAGLRTSKSDYYVFIKTDALDVIHCVYIIDTQTLRELESQNNFRKMSPPYAENFGWLLPERKMEELSQEFANNELNNEI